jgi:hypothetical protein
MRHAFFLLCLLALCSCSTPKESVVDTLQESTSDTSHATVSSSPVYAPYEEDIDIGTGALLFFAKDGDSFAAKHDTLLQSLYASGSGVVSTYRIDFASATGARLRYGVVVSDTFVLLNASGVPIGRFINPTEEKIVALISGRVSSPASP